jgi:hypothetical protein
MCRVDLNRTTQSCGHRWYHLLTPCTASSSLSNCPGKLAIEGWEIKCDFCPFCAGWDLSTNEFMVLGGSTARNGSVSSAASTSSGGYGDNSDLKFRSTPIGIPLSRQPSLTASVSGARRVSRSGSFAGSDINISPYDAGPVLGALEKNQQMNARIHGYIDELPELSSDGKRSKSKFRKSRAVEREQEEQNNEQQENESPAWKRRSKSIISLVRRR